MLVSIEEKPETTGTAEENERKYTRTLLGRSSTVNDREANILTSPLCPKRGQVDKYDRSSLISDVNVRRLDPEYPDIWWLVQYNTTTIPFDDAEHPLQKVADIEWFAEEYEDVRLFDIHGKPIMNTAKDFIGAPYEDTRWVISISKNVARPNSLWLSYNNTINSAQIIIDGIPFRARTLKCKAIRVGPLQKEQWNGQTISYRTVSFNLHFKRDGWKERVANVGLNELVFTRNLPVVTGVRLKSGKYEYVFKKDKDGKQITKDGYKKQRIVFDSGPTTEVQPLDAYGKYLDTTDPSFNPNQLIQYEVDVYEERPFNLLPTR